MRIGASLGAHWDSLTTTGTLADSSLRDFLKSPHQQDLSELSNRGGGDDDNDLAYGHENAHDDDQQGDGRLSGSVLVSAALSSLRPKFQPSHVANNLFLLNLAQVSSTIIW